MLRESVCVCMAAFLQKTHYLECDIYTEIYDNHSKHFLKYLNSEEAHRLC